MNEVATYMCTVMDLLFVEKPESSVIPVGTMFIVPHQEDEALVELPDFTIICSGQALSRELYPELSPIYPHTGGFRDFVIPDLTAKFLIDFDENNAPVLGSGAIYFQTVPPILFPPGVIQS